MSVASKAALDLQVHVESGKHKRAIRGEISSAKVTSFFIVLGEKMDNAVLVTEDAFAFHTMKHHTCNKTADCTSFY